MQLDLLSSHAQGKQVWLTAFTDVMENLLAKVHLSITDTCDKIKEALLTMKTITLVIDSGSNFILEVKKKNNAWIICISGHYCVDLPSVTLVSFRHQSKRKLLWLIRKENSKSMDVCNQLWSLRVVNIVNHCSSFHLDLWCNNCLSFCTFQSCHPTSGLLYDLSGPQWHSPL